MARICKTAIDELRADGINVGLFRPITLKPYAYEACRKEIDKARYVVSVEMNMGQMIEDVRLSAEGTKPLEFFGKAGGLVPSVDEVASKVREIVAKLGKQGAKR